MAAAGAALLSCAPAAFAAAPPWPIDGQNVYSQRSSTAGPASVGTAKVAWQRTWDAPVLGTPIVADNGGVYVGDTAGDVRGFFWRDGRLAWTAGRFYVGGPVMGSLLYLNNNKCTPSTSTVAGCVYAVASTTGAPRLVALDPATGQIAWKSPVLDNQFGVDAWGSPAYSPAQNLIYVPLCACKAITNAQANPTNASVPTARGGVVAVDAATGDIRWKTYTVGATYTGGAVAGTPAVYDAIGRLYVGTDGSYQTGRVHPNTDSILALDTATGAITNVFTARTGDSFHALDQTRYVGFATGPILYSRSGTKVYVGAPSKDGNFYALNATDLTKAWSAQVAPPGQHAGIQAAAAWDKSVSLFGVNATPAAFWSLSTVAGAVNWLFPGNDVKHQGPITFGRGYLWSTDTAGFLDIQSVANSGRPAVRIPLPGKSTAGVSFGNSYAFAGVGTPGGTSGGIVAVK